MRLRDHRLTWLYFTWHESKWACNFTSHTIAIKITHGSDYRCVLSVGGGGTKKKKLFPGNQHSPVSPQMTMWFLGFSMHLLCCGHIQTPAAQIIYFNITVFIFVLQRRAQILLLKSANAVVGDLHLPAVPPALPGTTAITSVFACYCSNFPATEQQTTWNSRVTH